MRLAQSLEHELKTSTIELPGSDDDLFSYEYTAASLLTEVLDYSRSLHKLANEQIVYPSNSLARSILEMRVDLQILFDDRGYASYLAYERLSEIRRYFKSNADTPWLKTTDTINLVLMDLDHRLSSLRAKISPKYKDKKGFPINTAIRRFQWADMEVFYQTSFRNLSQGVHLGYSIRSITDGEISWPPSLPSAYPISAVQTAIDALAVQGVNILSKLGVNTLSVSAIVKEYQHFDKRVFEDRGH